MRWLVCVCVCVFADSMKALYMRHAVTGRAAVVLCVCVCVGGGWVGGGVGVVGGVAVAFKHDCCYCAGLLQSFAVTPSSV